MLSLRAESGEAWSVVDDTTPDAQLVVASQDCDIAAPVKTEPRVEALTARWTSNPAEILAARKGNSTRLFLLQEEKERALVADARRRVHLEKDSLSTTRFVSALTDPKTVVRFALWVGERYSRPAIANDVVDAIHKPLVKAVDKALKATNIVSDVLHRIDELRFGISDTRPWIVDFIAMLPEGEAFTPEEEAELGGWLHEVLVSADGPVQEIRIHFRTSQQISLNDYEATMHLSLDHYSAEAETQAA